MNLDQYISQLLYRYSCVSIPNFGAFLTEKVSAGIKENNHTFYPPKKVIYFNSHIKNNDGLLANHISQNENCSYDEAVSLIENQVLKWKNQLENHEFLIFKTIGLIKLNSENNMVFEPYENTNYLTESFGFSSYVSPTIKREVLKTIVNEEEEIIAEVVKEEKKTHREEIDKPRSNMRFIKYGAVATIFISMGCFGYISYIQQQEKKETLIVQKEVQKEVQSKIQEATFFISNPSTTNDLNDVKKTPFILISGAFRNHENATKAFKDLTEKGFDPQILEKNEHGLIPVTYGSYSSYPEAQEKLKEIQSNENKEAWLLIKEE